MTAPKSPQTSQGKTDWITPPKYLSAARKVFLSSIDLDPASDANANNFVKAARYYTPEDNGLSKSWRAVNVWCNPPGSLIPGKSAIGDWLDKMTAEYQAGHFEAGIFLAFNVNTSTRWFQRVINTRPICFPDHRIKFLYPDGRESNRPTKENLFVFVGEVRSPMADRFYHVFSQFGQICPQFPSRG